MDRVNLSWAAPTSDGGAPLSGYDIYEAVVPGGSPSLAGAVPGQATSYSVTDLHPGTRYWFYLTAVNPAGPSQRSNEVSISTQTTPPPVAPAPVPTTTISTTGRHVTQIQPPPAPGGLYALAGDDRVNLSWAGLHLGGGQACEGLSHLRGDFSQRPGQPGRDHSGWEDKLHRHWAPFRDELLALYDGLQFGRLEPTLERGLGHHCGGCDHDH